MRKRTAGLLKKLGELITLCAIEAAAVIYSPGNNQPTVWPSTSAATATINEFLSRPEAERMANSHTAKSFMEEKCRKKKEKAQRLITMNEERNIQALITSIYEGKIRIQDLDSETKNKLSAFTDKKIEELRKLQRLKGKDQQALHSPQVLPPSVQMPQVSQAASGLNMNVLGAGRNFQSPAAGHGQRMDVRGTTRLAPSLPLSLPLPTPNALVMSPNNTTAYRPDMTGRFHGQRNLGGMMQRALYPPRALSPALQMPSVSQVASGLQALNINGPDGGRNFSLPAAAAHGQYMTLGGMTQVAPSPLPLYRPTPNPLVMSLNSSATNRLDMTGRLYRQTTPRGMMQLPLTSPLSMSLPSPLSTAYSAGSVPGITGYNLTNASTRAHIGEINFGETNQHGPPLYLPLAFPPIHSSSNTFDMTGRPHEQTNFSGTSTFTRDGNFGGMIQHAPPSYLPLEMPRQIGQPPMPPTQYDASGSNMSNAEYRRSTVGFPTPATRALDLSNFGDDYRWDTDGFPAPAVNPLDPRNFSDLSDADWDGL